MKLSPPAGTAPGALVHEKGLQDALAVVKGPEGERCLLSKDVLGRPGSGDMCEHSGCDESADVCGLLWAVFPRTKNDRQHIPFQALPTPPLQSLTFRKSRMAGSRRGGRWPAAQNTPRKRPSGTRSAQQWLCGLLSISETFLMWHFTHKKMLCCNTDKSLAHPNVSHTRNRPSAPVVT